MLRLHACSREQLGQLDEQAQQVLRAVERGERLRLVDATRVVELLALVLVEKNRAERLRDEE